MVELAAPPKPQLLTSARNAVAVAFALNGFCFASWASRIPSARDALSLSPAQLGLLLLCLSGGACLALPTSGTLVHRLGTARVARLGSLGVSLGLLCFAVGLMVKTPWPAAVGLVITGVGISTWDVAMNVEGAAVERGRGRLLMPRLHAAFSLGTVAGGGVSVVSAATGFPLAGQLICAAVLAQLSMTVATRRFLDATEPDPKPQDNPAGSLSAWLEPRTLLIGLLTLAFSFTEGSANDWLSVALVDGHDTSEAMGAVGFGAFVTAMTVARLCGGAMLERFGRVAMLRGTAVLAASGLLLVALGSSVVVALVGALLWGLGASLGFPVGISAASDDPRRAAVRVSVVSSIAYTAFLAGPPLIGFLADHTGIRHALLVVLGALVAGGLAASAARPLSDNRSTAS